MSVPNYKEIFEHLFTTDDRSDIHVAFDYLKKMYDYVLCGGKGFRSKTVLNTYRHLSGLDCCDNKMNQAQVLGCCIEILQASFLLHDDLMDHSELRRQKRCWYLEAQDMGYGLIGINDGLFLNTVVHKILIEYFRSETYFVDLIELFNDVISRTCTGQCLDMITSPSVLDLAKYTKIRYSSIVQWKTAYYSFYLPVVSGMIIAGVKDKSVFRAIEKIMMKVGEYFQIQDDVLDCYGDMLLIGKKGNDIEEGKCGWLIVQALGLVNEHQLKELEACYGKDDADCVARVKQVYRELDLERLYREYEEQTYNDVNTMISDLKNGVASFLPVEIFTDILNTLYKRDK